MTVLSRSKNAAARLLLTGLRIGGSGGLDRCPVGDARRRQRRSTGPVASGSGSPPPESDLSETTPAPPRQGSSAFVHMLRPLHSLLSAAAAALVPPDAACTPRAWR